ncbi:MAG TPA: lysophospholipid acyltransferase family protein [Actinomycetota bacterium]|nr:lysophospholipid acyltransferase family protein [Actinomycetota bacterium]
MTKGILKPWLKVWFRWRIEGADNIPRRGAAILAVNHIAYLDPFAAAYIVDHRKRRPRFLAKSELFQDRRIAWILRGCGQIEVRRGTANAPMALDHALDALARGEIVVVFPEGTITNDPDLNPMAPKTGAARLALESGAPLLPCAVWGTQNIWPKGYAKHWKPRQQVLMRVGSPLDVSGDPSSPAAWAELGEKLMSAISNLLAGLRNELPDRRRPKKKAA